MIEASQIKEHMPVVCSENGQFAVVDLTHPLKSTRRFREKRSVRTADTRIPS